MRKIARNELEQNLHVGRGHQSSEANSRSAHVKPTPYPYPMRQRWRRALSEVNCASLNPGDQWLGSTCRNRARPDLFTDVPQVDPISFGHTSGGIATG